MLRGNVIVSMAMMVCLVNAVFVRTSAITAGHASPCDFSQAKPVGCMKNPGMRIRSWGVCVIPGIEVHPVSSRSVLRAVIRCRGLAMRKDGIVLDEGFAIMIRDIVSVSRGFMGTNVNSRL